MSKTICPKCNGNGNIIDGIGAFCAALSIVLIPLIFIENDSSGITRQKCDICKGRGFINGN